MNNLFPNVDVANATPADRAAKKRADLKTTLAVYEKLKLTLEPAGDKTFLYKSGWDDAKIAEATGVTERFVMDNRVQMFGRLRPTYAEAAPSRIDVYARLTDLEARLAHLEAELGVTRNPTK